MNKIISSNREEIISSMTPKRDFIFKKLFGTVGKERLVKDFLEAILNIKIKSLTLGQETTLLPESELGKTGVLDVKVELEDGSIVDIEMQRAENEFIVERAHFYASRMYSGQLKKGQGYEELNKVIVIFIMDFNLFNSIKEYHTKWVMTERQNVKMSFDEIELHFIELPKFLASKYDKKRKLDQWLLFIDYSQKELVKSIMDENEVVKEADEELRKLQMDEYLQELEFRQLLNEYEKEFNKRRRQEKEDKRVEERAEKLAEIKAEKLAEIKVEKLSKTKVEKRAQEMLEEKIRETVKRMIKNNIDVETIMIATEMSKEEIEKIKEEM